MQIVVDAPFVRIITSGTVVSPMRIFRQETTKPIPIGLRLQRASWSVNAVPRHIRWFRGQNRRTHMWRPRNSWLLRRRLPLNTCCSRFSGDLNINNPHKHKETMRYVLIEIAATRWLSLLVYIHPQLFSTSIRAAQAPKLQAAASFLQYLRYLCTFCDQV